MSSQQPDTPQVATREAILELDDSTSEQVYVPQWKLTVWVRSMSAHERDRLESRIMGKNGQADPSKLTNFRAHLAVASVVDANGAPMFTTADVDALSNRSAAALDVIAEAAMRLSGLSQKDVSTIVGE